MGSRIISNPSLLPSTSASLASKFGFSKFGFLKFSDANINPVSPLDDNLIDIVLIVGNSRIHCHRLVLGMTSKFFERMFASNMKNSNCPEIELKEVDLETMTSVISFMYQDEIDDKRINVDLLAAADMYQLLR